MVGSLKQLRRREAVPRAVSVTCAGPDWRVLLAALTDEEQGNQLLGSQSHFVRKRPLSVGKGSKLQRAVLAMCLAGSVEMNNSAEGF